MFCFRIFSCALFWVLFVARAVGAPANDNFLNATLLATQTGFTNGNNVDATWQVGEPYYTEPADVRSVWYRWSPAVNGPCYFSTEGSSFDTILAVYTGTSVNALTELAWNDDSDFAADSTSYVEFQATTGTTYWIAVDGYRGAVGSINLTWGSVRPVNDDFARGTKLGGFFGAISGFNINATAETAEPNAGNSIWYRWTAPTNGMVAFNTSGSSFDTILCVYTGASLSSLAAVVCDDNGGSNQTSLVTFTAQQGVTYAIGIRGFNNAAGSVELKWNYPGLAAVELLPDLFVWASEEQDLLYGWKYDFNEMPGRVLLRLSTATPNAGSGPLELQGDSSRPEVYQRIYRGDGSFTDRLAGTFTFHPTHQHLHFDNFMRFQLREVVGTNGVGDPVGTGHKTSFAVIDLEPYDLNLPAASPYEVYGDGLLQGISVGWTDIYSSDLPDQWIDITDVLPGWYWLEAMVDPEDRIREVNETNNASRIMIYVNPFAPPANDNFVNAAEFVGMTAGAEANNALATLEFDDPSFNFDAVNSLWWRWTAPAAGATTITTEGSDFDTMLAVFSGSSIESLTLVAANDDIGNQLVSRVSFTAVAGRTYSILVAGINDETGYIELSLNPARNNNFASAVAISGLLGEVSGSNRGATAEAGEPAHHGIPASRSIWYSWVAPQNGSVTFDTIGSGVDTILGVYTGATVGGLARVASDDDSAGHLDARVTFSASAGVTYRIAVDGTTHGIIHLNWTQRTGEAPEILVGPASTNVFVGGALQLSVSARGSEPMSYSWRRQEGSLSNDGNISGVNEPTLNIRKMSAALDGRFEVVISNAFGSITSIPARVIVKQNPRIVFFGHALAASPGPVEVPLKIQAQGNEYAIEVSASFSTAHFTNPRLLSGRDAAGATILGDPGAASQGRFGITVILPAGQSLTAGEREFARLQLDLAPGAPQGILSPLGWLDSPVARRVTTANGAALEVLYVAGEIQVGPWTGFQSIQRQTDGHVRLTLNGIHDQTYVIDLSTNLQSWLPVRTNLFESNGPKIEIDSSAAAAPVRFYRARLLNHD